MGSTDVIRRLAVFLFVASLLPVVGLAQVTRPAVAPAAGQMSAPASNDGPMVTAQRAGETREQMLARFGLVVDPGANPDPKKKFVRFGKQYTIEQFENRYAKPGDSEGWVRPFAYVNAQAEVYQKNDKYTWVFMPELEAPPELPKDPKGNTVNVREYTDEDLKYIRMMKPDFTPLDPPASDVTVKFGESSSGLPVKGSWRNSAAVADMNEDGFPDIVAPPQRSALDNEPAIFLGDGKGSWTRWEAVE